MLQVAFLPAPIRALVGWDAAGDVCRGVASQRVSTQRQDDYCVAFSSTRVCWHMCVQQAVVARHRTGMQPLHTAEAVFRMGQLTRVEQRSVARLLAAKWTVAALASVGGGLPVGLDVLGLLIRVSRCGGPRAQEGKHGEFGKGGRHAGCVCVCVCRWEGLT